MEGTSQRPFLVKTFLICLPFRYFVLVHSVDMCPSGYVLYTPKEGPDTCLPCNPGTFISDEYHKHKLCHDCTQIVDPDIEIMVRPCNTVEDTVIHCTDGYFRNQSSSTNARDHCQKCSTTCEFPRLPCDRFKDTVCCPGDNYDVVINKHEIPVCVQLCGQGEFYDQDANKCASCPDNSYMDETKHTHTFCRPCLWPKSVAEVVVHPCNRTHPAVIGCKVGWYKSTSSHSSHTTCIRCQRCSQNKSGQVYERRACNETSDTVCCKSNDMIVMDNECVKPQLTKAEPKERTSPSVIELVEDNASLEMEDRGREESEQTEDGSRCEENQTVRDTRTNTSSAALSSGTAIRIALGISVSLNAILIVFAIVYVVIHRQNNVNHANAAYKASTNVTNKEATDRLYVANVA